MTESPAVLRSLRFHQVAHLGLLACLYATALLLLKTYFLPLASWGTFLATVRGLTGAFLPPIIGLLGVYVFLLGPDPGRIRQEIREWVVEVLYGRVGRLRLMNLVLLLCVLSLAASTLCLAGIRALPTEVLPGEHLVLGRGRSRYTLNHTLEVREGGRLEILPGVRISLGPAGGIVSYGELIARGTYRAPIYVASIAPEARWRNVTIWGKHASASLLEYVVISNGGGIGVRNVAGEVRIVPFSDPTGDLQGGGVLVIGSSPTILDCEIRNNRARYGGGMAIRDGASPRIERTRVVSNTANHPEVSGGGGIWISQANPEIRNSDVSSNEAIARSAAGGGIYIGLQAHPTILGNTIVANRVDGDGGGIYVRDSGESAVRFEIRDNEIRDNVARQFGGGVCLDGASSPEVIGNAIIGNRTVGFDNIWERTKTSAGGGVFIGGELQRPRTSAPVFMSNRILGNIAFPVFGALGHLDGTGGGIACFNTAIVVLGSNRISHNLARTGGGLYRTLDCQVRDAAGQDLTDNEPDDYVTAPIHLYKRPDS